MININQILKQLIYNEGICTGIIKRDNQVLLNEKEIYEKKILMLESMDIRDLEQNKSIIISNIWSEICMEIVVKNKLFFRRYFLEKSEKLAIVLANSIYNIFIEIGSDIEKDYLDYKILDKERIPNEEYLVSDYLKNRNLYKCLKDIYPQLAQKVYIDAVKKYNLYKMDLTYLKESRESLLSKFSKLKTYKGRLKFLENEIWLKIRISEEEKDTIFDISYLININKDIVELLNYALSEGNFKSAVAILDIVLFVFGMSEDQNIIMLKEPIINKIKQFTHIKEIDEIYNILECL